MIYFSGFKIANAKSYVRTCFFLYYCAATRARAFSPSTCATVLILIRLHEKWLSTCSPLLLFFFLLRFPQSWNFSSFKHIYRCASSSTLCTPLSVAPPLVRKTFRHSARSCVYAKNNFNLSLKKFRWKQFIKFPRHYINTGERILPTKKSSFLSSKEKPTKRNHRVWNTKNILGEKKII